MDVPARSGLRRSAITGRLVPFVVTALALTGCVGEGASSATPVPLTWEIVQELGDVYVDSLVATPAGVFGLQRELWDESDGRGGLWLSGDGRSFEFVESDELFGRDASIELLTAGGPDLVAAGLLPSAEGHRVVVWTSPDGRDWTAVDTGYIAVAGVGMGLQMMAIAARPQGAVILAWEGEFFTVHDAKVVEEQIRAHLPPGLRDLENLGFGPDGAGVRVGPFLVWEQSLEDAGVDPALAAAYRRWVNGGKSFEPVQFVTDDYATWEIRRDRQLRTSLTVAATVDGYLAAVPWQRNGDNLVRSTDGRSWELVSAPDGIAGGYSALTVVDDGVVATGSTGLWETDDAGLTWEPIAPLPADFAESGPGPLSVGPLGFLATPVYGVWDEAPPPPVIQFSIERDGRTLTIGADRLTVTATDGSAIVELPVRGPVWDSLEPPDGFVFDHETGTATVVEPVTARPVFTVTYRELDEAFLAAVRAADLKRSPGDPMVAFSLDGATWTTEEVVAATGFPGWVTNAVVGNDAVWMIVGDFDYFGHSHWAIVRGSPGW